VYFYSSLTPLRASTIAIAIVGRAITIWEAIQKRSHDKPIYKTYTKNEAKGLRAITFTIVSPKHLQHQKLFRILGAPIIFPPALINNISP
jgi:hypothetical protein